ncbi:MAG: hypothetical protein JW716_05980 [Candidatus Aenigmarchaeota archaeon]|nr:hypothetical protein [Candidatus Aenigmarchaeota archaeon]
MRKLILTGVFLLSLFILFNPLISAAGVEITGTDSKTIEFGKSTRFDFTVKNSLNMMMDIVVLVEGKHSEWVTLDKYFFLVPALSQKQLDVVVFPQDNGTQTYKLTVQSISMPNVYQSFAFSLKAVGDKKSEILVKEKKTSIQTVDAKISGSNIQMGAVILKPDETAITVDFYLKDINGDVILSYIKVLEGSGSKTVDYEFPTDGLLAGSYVTEVFVRDLMLSKIDTVVIPEARNVKKTREVTSGFLYETVLISVENLGNVVEHNYAFGEEVPLSEYIVWDVPPHASRSLDNGVIEGIWTIETMNPGDKVYISYTINYWFSLMKIIIAVILVLIAVAIVYMKMSRPSITKRFVKKGSNHFLVILEAKGSFFTSIKSVLIKDTISPLMEVEGKFEGIAPVIRKGKDNTELLWRIGTMKRMDERILSYNVRGKVEAQIKLHPAVMRYKKTEEGEKRRVFSNTVHVE